MVRSCFLCLLPLLSQCYSATNPTSCTADYADSGSSEAATASMLIPDRMLLQQQANFEAAALNGRRLMQGSLHGGSPIIAENAGVLPVSLGIAADAASMTKIYEKGNNWPGEYTQTFAMEAGHQGMTIAVFAGEESDLSKNRPIDRRVLNPPPAAPLGNGSVKVTLTIDADENLMVQATATLDVGQEGPAPSVNWTIEKDKWQSATTPEDMRPVPKRGLSLRAVVEVDVEEKSLGAYGLTLTHTKPVRISSITSGSPAASAKTLSPGMRILRLQGHTVNKKHKDLSGAGLTHLINKFLASEDGVTLSFETNVCPLLQRFESLYPWWFSWGAAPSGPDLTSCEKRWDAGFIPMMYSRHSLSASLSPYGADALLGFNEPNRKGHAHMSPMEVAAAWHKVEQAAKNKAIKRIGSPSVSGFCTNSGKQCSLDTIKWFDQFFCHCQNCQVDFLTTQTYMCDAENVVAFLDVLHRRYGKPIWLTEFNCGDSSNQPQEKQLSFMKEILPALEELEYVERYSWSSQSPDSDVVKDSALIDTLTGDLTDLGSFYVEFPAKPTFEINASRVNLDCSDILTTTTTTTTTTAVPVYQCSQLCEVARIDLQTLGKPKHCSQVGKAKCQGNYALRGETATPCFWDADNRKCRAGKSLTCPYMKAKCAGCLKFCGANKVLDTCGDVPAEKCPTSYVENGNDIFPCSWDQAESKCFKDAVEMVACPSLQEACESEGLIVGSK